MCCRGSKPALPVSRFPRELLAQVLARLCTTTEAPRTTDPLGSVTLPPSEPVNTTFWALSNAQLTPARTVQTIRRLIMVSKACVKGKKG